VQPLGKPNLTPQRTTVSSYGQPGNYRRRVTGERLIRFEIDAVRSSRIRPRGSQSIAHTALSCRCSRCARTRVIATTVLLIRLRDHCEPRHAKSASPSPDLPRSSVGLTQQRTRLATDATYSAVPTSRNRQEKDLCPNFLAGFSVGLSGSAEVLAHFSFACYLCRTTL
jgi:hypothetical protein